MSPTPVDLETRVRVLETRADNRDEDFRALSDTIVETRNEVRMLSGKVDGLTGRVVVLEGKFDTLQRDVTGLKQDVGGLKQDVGWLKHGMQAILTHLGLSVEPDSRDS